MYYQHCLSTEEDRHRVSRYEVRCDVVRRVGGCHRYDVIGNGHVIASNTYELLAWLPNIHRTPTTLLVKPRVTHDVRLSSKSLIIIVRSKVTSKNIGYVMMCLLFVSYSNRLSKYYATLAMQKKP